MKVWLLSVLFASAILAQGFALECFVCADCHSPFDRAAHKPEECTNDNLFPVDPPTTTVGPTEPTTTTEDTSTSTPPPTTIPPITTVSTDAPPTSEDTSSSPDTTTTTTTSESTSDTSDGAQTPPPTTAAPTTTTPQSRFRRAVRAADSEFRCFVTEFEKTTRRGCTRWRAGETETCTAIGGQNCRVCNEAGCNSGTSLVMSFTAILLAVCVALRVL